MKQKHSFGRSAFTLIELVVTVTIGGVIVSMLFPAIHAGRESARRSQCSNNLKRIGAGQQVAHDALNRFIPGGDRNAIRGGGSREKAVGWGLLILPYVGGTAIFNRFDPDDPGGLFSEQHRELAGTVIADFLCPSSAEPERPPSDSPATALLGASGELSRDRIIFGDGSVAGGRTHYAAVHGSMVDVVDRNRFTAYYAHWPCMTPGYSKYSVGGSEAGAPSGAMPAIQILRKPSMYVDREMIPDGTGNTIMVTEDSESAMSHWGHHHNLLVWKQDCAERINQQPYGAFPRCAVGENPLGEKIWQFHDIRSMHPGGVNAVYADAHVGFLAMGTEFEVIRRLLNRRDTSAPGP